MKVFITPINCHCFEAAQDTVDYTAFAAAEVYFDSGPIVVSGLVDSSWQVDGETPVEVVDMAPVVPNTRDNLEVADKEQID